MTRTIPLLIAIFALFSCGKDDEELRIVTDRIPIDCIGERLVDTIDQAIGCIFVLDTTQHCEKELIETPVFLKPESKFWLSQFCNEVGDSLLFVNEFKRQLHLIIEERKLSFWFVNQEVEGEYADDKEKQYVFPIEVARVVMRIAGTEQTLELFMAPILNFDGTTLSSGQRLAISHHKDNLTYVPMDFTFDAGDLSEVKNDGIEFYDEYELINETFVDVYTDNRFQTGSMQIFYNEAFGIVGFKDDRKITWKLKVR